MNPELKALNDQADHLVACFLEVQGWDWIHWDQSDTRMKKAAIKKAREAMEAKFQEIRELEAKLAKN